MDRYNHEKKLYKRIKPKTAKELYADATGDILALMKPLIFDLHAKKKINTKDKIGIS